MAERGAVGTAVYGVPVAAGMETDCGGRMKQVLVFHLKPGGKIPQVGDTDGNMTWAAAIPGAPWLAVIAVEVDASLPAQDP